MDGDMESRNVTTSNGLAPNQIKALGLLLSGATGQATADSCDVRRETIARWKKESHFAVALEEGRQELLQSSKLRLTTLFQEALDVLGELLQSDSEMTRARATNTIMATALRIPSTGDEPKMETMSESELKAEIERIDRDIRGRDQTARDVVVDRSGGGGEGTGEGNGGETGGGREA